MTAERLDVALASQGLARSRSHAAALIAAGAVSVDGAVVLRASHRVAPGQRLTVEGDHGYVSRGALKLLAALDGFGVDVDGRLALDAGASTGGFTEVLLERGARRVVAVDVGHGQLAPKLQHDPRVDAHEGVNVRSLTAGELARLTGSDDRPEVVVGDLSFISLTLVLKPLVAVAAEDAPFILLIKPQFEVGRSGIREGVVRDPRRRLEAVTDVLWAAHDAGLGTAGIMASPIPGGAGNREFLALFRRGAALPGEWSDDVERLTTG
jgi:23S rRNA (cytidine1920-2'-O)/16S rRNA (cytidine1409-2'-O)-methyltransferase